jgi:hypothetical protein
MRNLPTLPAFMLIACIGTHAAAQPANHIGEPLAQLMIEAGCTLTEAEAAAGLQQRGYGIGDLQAQVTALLNGRFLGSTNDGKWKLQGWPPCN